MHYIATPLKESFPSTSDMPIGQLSMVPEKETIILQHN